MPTQEARKISGTPHLEHASHARWLALTRRDPASHSAFIYGVKSTKIYCRPTCPARLARRANVVFYDNAEQARGDGFRPCKRCQPEDASYVGAGEVATDKMLALLRVRAGVGAGDGGVGLQGGLKAFAQEVGVSPSYLCRVFKKTMGMTIGAYTREFEKGADDADAVSEGTDVVSSSATPQSTVSTLDSTGTTTTTATTPGTSDSAMHTPDVLDFVGLDTEPALAPALGDASDEPFLACDVEDMPLTNDDFDSLAAVMDFDFDTTDFSVDEFSLDAIGFDDFAGFARV